MPICVSKKGDLCDRMSSRENEARFLHQNEVNFARQRNKMAANLDLFCKHLHRQPNNSNSNSNFLFCQKNLKKYIQTYI